MTQMNQTEFPNEGRDSEGCRAMSEAIVVDIMESRLIQVVTVLLLVGLVASYFTHLPPPVMAAIAFDAAMAHPLEAVSSFFGVVGTLLLATRGKWAGWGFVAFLASNAGWLWFSLGHGFQWMFWQQVAFTVSSVLGVWVWLVKGRA
jgi:hypothetical protein